MRTIRSGLVLVVCTSLFLAASTAPSSGNQEPEARSLASSEAVLFPKVSETTLDRTLDVEIQRVKRDQAIYYAAVKAEMVRKAQEQESARRAQEERERRRAAEAVAPPSSPPPAPPLARTGSCGGWEKLVTAYFGSESGTACRVLMCESHGNPTAYNPSSASGLFQFLRSTWQRMLGMSGEARDHPPEVQIQQAKRLRDMAGWGQWSCY